MLYYDGYRKSREHIRVAENEGRQVATRKHSMQAMNMNMNMNMNMRTRSRLIYIIRQYLTLISETRTPVLQRQVAPSWQCSFLKLDQVDRFQHSPTAQQLRHVELIAGNHGWEGRVGGLR